MGLNSTYILKIRNSLNLVLLDKLSSTYAFDSTVMFLFSDLTFFLEGCLLTTPFWRHQLSNHIFKHAQCRKLLWTVRCVSDTADAEKKVIKQNPGPQAGGQALMKVRCSERASASQSSEEEMKIAPGWLGNCQNSTPSQATPYGMNTAVQLHCSAQ